MTNDTATVAAKVARGVAIGLIAGLAASFVMERAQALVPPPSSGGDDDDDQEPATQQAADAVAEAATGTPVPEDRKPAAGQAVHYALGAGLGIAYGLAAQFAPRVTAGAGTAFGGATWAVLDEGAVPLAGLGDAPWRSPLAGQAYGFASHMVFGVTAELVRRLGEGALARATGARD